MTAHPASPAPLSSARGPWVAALVVGLGTAVLLVLGAGALGIIGAGEADRLYLGVLAVLVVGSLLARLRARAMVAVLLVTAAAVLVVPVVAWAADLVGDASVLDVVGLTATYAGGFVASAVLFARAAAGRHR